MERGEDSLSYVLANSRNMQKFICESVRGKKLGETLKNRASLLNKKADTVEDKEKTMMSGNSILNKK